MSFIYGGCRGNENRFKTLKDCEKQCDRGMEISTDNVTFITYRYMHETVETTLFFGRGERILRGRAELKERTASYLQVFYFHFWAPKIEN